MTMSVSAQAAVVEENNQAFADAASGTVIKPVVLMDH